MKWMQIVDILILKKKKDSMRDRIAYVFNKQLSYEWFLTFGCGRY